MDAIKQLDRLEAAIERLTESVDKRFDAVDKRFDAVDKRFEAVDKRFDAVDKRFAETDKQLDRIAQNVVIGFAAINAKFEEVATKDEVQRIMNYLDDVMKKQEISEAERLVMGHQLERLDKWTHELAKKIGYTLST